MSADWYKEPLMVYEISMQTRRGKSMRNDPDYQRVEKRMREEARAMRPIVVSSEQQAKTKRRDKNKAARKARKHK